MEVTNISQHTTAGIDDLIDVKLKLLTVAVGWRDIGLVLGISDSKLAIIEAKKLEADDSLTDMLRLWLNRTYIQCGEVWGAILAFTERSRQESSRG